MRYELQWNSHIILLKGTGSLKVLKKRKALFAKNLLCFLLARNIGKERYKQERDPLYINTDLLLFFTVMLRSKTNTNCVLVPASSRQQTPSQQSLFRVRSLAKPNNNGDFAFTRLYKHYMLLFRTSGIIAQWKQRRPDDLVIVGSKHSDVLFFFLFKHAGKKICRH